MLSFALLLTQKMKALCPRAFSLGLICCLRWDLLKRTLSASFLGQSRSRFRSSAMGWAGNSRCIIPRFRPPT